ncbi:hypothetical protein [Nostoc sp. LPT]|uniref:hypothetical protein n=1 Tax=Nostoc sp. LPT TaxID=2815387 RepID=UPI001DC5FECE|nr:hypothetical protein [Nostoc sp. LPT]MBN4004769.1 hypothetical protein [Nostoc sp. LPT]
MKIKTITYQRVVNLGNYESKRLELFAELQEGENEEVAISALMEKVEQNVTQQSFLLIEIKDLKNEIKDLKKEIAELESKKDKLTGVEEPNPDDIPFDSGGPTSDDPADF